jgi:transcriptional regulator with XRE-family HTH domain
MAKIPQDKRNKILNDLCNKNLMQKEIAARYGVSTAFVSQLKESHEKGGLNIERLIKKGTSYKIRVTSYLKGTLKNKFIKDCLDKGYNESQMSNHVYETYYFIQESIHNFEKIEPNKIKDYLKARIKL